MIKLLHLADVHLGATFRMLGEKGAAQRRQVEETFARAIDLAIDERVQMVLIAGDLFDSPKPAPATVEATAGQFRRLAEAGIRVALVAGNHDGTLEGQVPDLERLRRANPAILVFGRTVEVQVLPDLDLTVVGRSAEPGAMASPLANWPRGHTTRFAVGVTHGSSFRAGQVEGPGTIHPQEIRDLGLDYLALGDWHSAIQLLPPPSAAWYAGSPELLAFDQEGAGHVLLVELSAPGRAEVTPRRIGRRRYQALELNAADVDDLAVRRALEGVADPELMVDVVLTGLVPVGRVLDLEAIERDLSASFFRLRLHNRAQLHLDAATLTAFPEQTVLGRFVRLMEARMATASESDQAVVAEALQVGVALLHGKDVLA